MPRTVGHIVATHQIAAERRARGRSQWNRKFNVGDIFHDDDMPIEDKVTEIARRIRAEIQPRFREDEDLEMLIDEMEWIVQQFGHPDKHRDQIGNEFDCVWDGFYDWCDLVGRVWVET